MTENRRRMWKVPAGQWLECCNRCGALVGDAGLHDAWHAENDAAATAREAT